MAGDSDVHPMSCFGAFNEWQPGYLEEKLAYHVVNCFLLKSKIHLVVIIHDSCTSKVDIPKAEIILKLWRLREFSSEPIQGG